MYKNGVTNTYLNKPGSVIVMSCICTLRIIRATQVPCILGVNLTGKDLMEFIQQVTAVILSCATSIPLESSLILA